MAIPQTCPLCGAGAEYQSVVTAHVYGGNNRRAIFQCEACDLRYLHPGLGAGDEAALYAKEFEKFMANRSAEGAGWERPEAHIAANEPERLRRLGHLAGFLNGPSKRILEVGCSSGFMLYPLMEAGHHCIGIEPSGVFSDYVRSRGIPCYADLQDLPTGDEGFDLILHYYVLEHVSDPFGFLQTQLSRLKTGGVLIFEVPCVSDALTALYDIPAYERFIWVVSHRWYFSSRSLGLLLSRLGGGEVAMDQRYDLSNHLIWARDGKPGGMGRFTEILGQDLEKAYKQALIRAGYGDTLIGIIRR